MLELFKQDDLTRSGLNAEVLLQKFKEQLLRDFEMSNAVDYLQPLTDLSYSGIVENVKRAIEKMTKSCTASYHQLLYRIDISEKQLTKTLDEQRDKNESEIVAELIIKRILQKVILKVIYSK